MTAEDSTMSEQWAVDHRPGCGDSVKDTSDAAPSWAVDAAEVLAVYDRCVALTPAQLRRAARRWA